MSYSAQDRCDVCGTGLDVQRDNKTGDCLCSRCFLDDASENASNGIKPAAFLEAYEAHHLSVRATELREALLWALRTLPVGCPACGYRLDEPKRVECTEDHRNMAALLPAPDEVKP